MRTNLEKQKNQKDVNISIPAGKHVAVVQAWDASVAVFKNSMTIDVN